MSISPVETLSTLATQWNALKSKENVWIRSVVDLQKPFTERPSLVERIFLWLTRPLRKKYEFQGREIVLYDKPSNLQALQHMVSDALSFYFSQEHPDAALIMKMERIVKFSHEIGLRLGGKGVSQSFRRTVRALPASTGLSPQVCAIAEQLLKVEGDPKRKTFSALVEQLGRRLRSCPPENAPLVIQEGFQAMAAIDGQPFEFDAATSQAVLSKLETISDLDGSIVGSLWPHLPQEGKDRLFQMTLGLIDRSSSLDQLITLSQGLMPHVQAGEVRERLAKEMLSRIRFVAPYDFEKLLRFREVVSPLTKPQNRLMGTLLSQSLARTLSSEDPRKIITELPKTLDVLTRNGIEVDFEPFRNVLKSAWREALAKITEDITVSGLTKYEDVRAIFIALRNFYEYIPPKQFEPEGAFVPLPVEFLKSIRSDWQEVGSDLFSLIHHQLLQRASQDISKLESEKDFQDAYESLLSVQDWVKTGEWMDDATPVARKKYDACLEYIDALIDDLLRPLKKERKKKPEEKKTKEPVQAHVEVPGPLPVGFEVPLGIQEQLPVGQKEKVPEKIPIPAAPIAARAAPLAEAQRQPAVPLKPPVPKPRAARAAVPEKPPVPKFRAARAAVPEKPPVPKFRAARAAVPEKPSVPEARAPQAAVPKKPSVPEARAPQAAAPEKLSVPETRAAARAKARLRAPSAAMRNLLRFEALKKSLAHVPSLAEFLKPPPPAPQAVVRMPPIVPEAQAAAPKKPAAPVSAVPAVPVVPAAPEVKAIESKEKAAPPVSRAPAAPAVPSALLEEAVKSKERAAPPLSPMPEAPAVPSALVKEAVESKERAAPPVFPPPVIPEAYVAEEKAEALVPPMPPEALPVVQAEAEAKKEETKEKAQVSELPAAVVLPAAQVNVLLERGYLRRMGICAVGAGGTAALAWFLGPGVAAAGLWFASRSLVLSMVSQTTGRLASPAFQKISEKTGLPPAVAGAAAQALVIAVPAIGGGGSALCSSALRGATLVLVQQKIQPAIRGRLGEGVLGDVACEMGNVIAGAGAQQGVKIAGCSLEYMRAQVPAAVLRGAAAAAPAVPAVAPLQVPAPAVPAVAPLQVPAPEEPGMFAALLGAANALYGGQAAAQVGLPPGVNLDQVAQGIPSAVMPPPTQFVQVLPTITGGGIPIS